MNMMLSGGRILLCAFCDKTQTAASGTTVGGAAVMGILAMALIYAVTVFLPKIAAGVDKLLGGKAESGKKQADIPDDNAEPSPERVGESYKVYDIYEGEMNLDDYDKKE